MTASSNSAFRRRPDPPPLWANNVVDLLPEVSAKLLDRVSWVAELGVLTLIPNPSQPWLSGYPRIIHIRDSAGDRFPGSGILGLKTCPVGGQVSAFEYLKRTVVENALSRTGARHLWAWSTTEVDELLIFVEWLRNVHKMELPANILLGTRIQTASNLTRVASLLRAGAPHTKHFVIFEPSLEQVNLRSHLNGIDWCIAGQSRQLSACRFDVNVARQLRDACRRARTALFITAIGSSACPIKTKGGTNWYLWPSDLQVRALPDPTFLLPGRNPEAMARKIKSLRTRSLEFAEARASWPTLASRPATVG